MLTNSAIPAITPARNAARSLRANHSPMGLVGLLGLLWRNRMIGVGTVIVLSGFSGLLVAQTMPRGPVTTPQAVVAIAAGLLLGFVAGVGMKSRWAMLLAPAVQVAAFELARSGVSGPTVGPPQFDTTMSIVAFIAGRGTYAAFAMVPIVLAATYGAALARRVDRLPAGRRAHSLMSRVRLGTTWLATAGLVALLAPLLVPATTPPILGPDGQTLAGSVAALQKIQVGGHEQWLLIRGHNVNNPVLLYLSGGPGQSDLAFSRGLYDELSKDVTFVGWDQRGSGKSYAALDPSTLTLAQAVSDTVEVTNYLRQRFHQQKIYLIGESWGTVLGVLAIQRNPELYYAYLGSGQMVDLRETDTRINRDVLAYAQKTGNATLASKVRSYGPVPYRDVSAYGFMMEQYPLIETPYSPPAATQAISPKLPGSIAAFPGIMGDEYNLVDKIGAARGLIDMFATMYPQLQGIDFRRDASRLEVPVYFLEGRHELAGRLDLALQWYGQLQAPHKQLYMFEDAGHSVMMEEFQPLQHILKDVVLPQTYPGRGPAATAQMTPNITTTP